MSKEKAERVINEKQFIALLKDADQKTDRAKNITAELTERVKHAVDNAHLNRGAFNLSRRVLRMDEDKRNDFLRSFDLYLDYMQKNRMLGEQHCGDLVDLTIVRDSSEMNEFHSDDLAADPDAEAAAANTALLEKGIHELTDDEKQFDDATAEKPSRRQKKEALEGATTAGTYKHLN